MRTNTKWPRCFLFSTLFAASIFLSTGCSPASDEEVAQIAAALDLQAGAIVADVGAGEGVLLPFLASWVGPEGRVFATEIEAVKVDELRRLAVELELKQVSALLGTPTSTGLSDSCCDAIITRMVYHHLTEPNLFIESLYSALKPGGRLLIVDFHPSIWMSGSTPDDLPEGRSGHGVDPSLVVEEVEFIGFELIQRDDNWPGPGGVLLDHFALLFVRA